MGNILDYIVWRGDLSFGTSPFNEVDNLILAELAYTKMEEIVPGPESAETVTVRELCKGYEERGYKALGNSNDAYPLLRAAAGSERFSSVRVGAYVNRIDTEKEIQFAAVCFYLDDGSVFVAFRGTDNTIVGWREDFSISYLSETPGQYEAVRYLNRVGVKTRGALRIGGHSKGGNLAVYASAFCEEPVKKRILAVYSNDGPGFNSAVVNTPEYQAGLDKVDLIIPESSLIGILLSNKTERKIITSSASGAQQHNPYTWQVQGPRFIETDSQSQASLFMDETMRRWLEGLNDTQRANLVNAIFNSMDAAGVQTLTELTENRWNAYNAILKAVMDMDPALQKDVLQTAQKLAAAGRGVLWEDAQSSFRELADQLLKQITEHNS